MMKAPCAGAFFISTGATLAARLTPSAGRIAAAAKVAKNTFVINDLNSVSGFLTGL